MKKSKLHNILYIIGVCLVLLICPSCLESMVAKDFVVVIDAGHGGHDPGAVGKFSKEKHINLSVALKLGKLIRRQCRDVKVIYTRETDVFIPLNRRAEIANDAKADLFISIHTNALAKNKTARGSSTWTLGLAKSDENLEVAKRENAVILYEDDYRTRYAGFNPNSAESYIIFEFMQDKYMSQSVHLASLVQQQLKSSCNRIDHGVHQAGFLVLKASAMPSILIELGYISTPSEERYLNSDEGMTSLANGIFRAFSIYKKEWDARLNGNKKAADPAPQVAKTEEKTDQSATSSEKDDDELIFKLQIFASSRLLPETDKRFKALKEVGYYKEGGLYKYTCGVSSDYNKILRLRRTLASRFKDAFVVAFKNGEKMDINAAINEFKQSRNR